MWDADALRDDIRSVAVQHLGSDEAILVVDETGDVKKAHLFLAMTRAAEHAAPTPAGIVPLTLNEIRHLFIRLAIGHAITATDCLRWSGWRRSHQYRAQQARYQRQSDQEP